MRPGWPQFRDPVGDNPSVVHLLFSFVMASGYCQLVGATRVAVSRALCGMKQAVKLFFALSRSEFGTLIAVP